MRRPAVVALERLFAATPRGAALINRIKADPALAASEIRVVSHDSDYTRVSRASSTGMSTPSRSASADSEPTPHTAPPATGALDWRGTRRAQRFQIVETINVLVDGNEARLVNLSTIGALVLSPTLLRPNQRVRLALPEDGGAIRISAGVVWVFFEIPGGQARYRAGLEFFDGDQRALTAFCGRNGRI